MHSSRSAAVVLTAALATIAALLAVTPAQAASSGLQVLSKTIAVYGPGAGENSSHPRGSTLVQVRCNGTRDCSGWASYRHIKPLGDEDAIPDAREGSKYWVGHGRTAYITVRLNDNQPVWNLSNFGPNQGRSAVLRFYVPGKADAMTAVTLTKRVAGVALNGKVTGVGLGTSRITDVKVTRWSVNGLVAKRDVTKPINSDGTFTFGTNYQLGPNNAATGNYRLSLSAQVDGSYRSFFWRGDDWGYDPGRFDGGATEIREASVVHLNRNGDFQANFHLGEIKGTIAKGSSTSPVANAKIRVAAAPFRMPWDRAGVRDLDIAYCANDFGAATTDANGNYSVLFLPRADSGTDKRYLVKASVAGGNAMNLWNDHYGSCVSTRLYKNSRDRLLAIPRSNVKTQDFTLRPATGIVDGRVNPSGYSPTASDRFVTLREFVPGLKILDLPIVKSGYARTGSVPYFHLGGVKPGLYWLESGRQTGCSAWYPSVYANNNSYLEGSDRGAEQWKTVAGKYPEHQKSYDMGYVPRTPPRGYQGWMYRPYCRATSAGTYQLVWVAPNPSPDPGTPAPNTYDRVTVFPTAHRGATISGHVSRGKHANKEFMVSAYSTLGVLVMRSAITNSNGDFRIEGLPTGNYRIATNTDSWRGNARTFTGKTSKAVKAGGHYSIGTLKVP